MEKCNTRMKTGGSDGTRTRDLLRDRQARSVKFFGGSKLS